MLPTAAPVSAVGSFNHLKSRRRSFGLGAVAAVFFASCGVSGASPGTPCTRPTDCASRLCLQRGDRFYCAQRCGAGASAGSTGPCATGEVCGRFDFRGTDADSGLFSGPTSEIIFACRSPLTTPCTATGRCADPRERCVGGVCAATCDSDGMCTTARCVNVGAAETCGAPGVCAPLCDEPSECPTGWYCDLTWADRLGHGRCDRMTDGGVTPAPDGGTCIDAGGTFDR